MAFDLPLLDNEDGQEMSAQTLVTALLRCCGESKLSAVSAVLSGSACGWCAVACVGNGFREVKIDLLCIRLRPGRLLLIILG